MGAYVCRLVAKDRFADQGDGGTQEDDHGSVGDGAECAVGGGGVVIYERFVAGAWEGAYFADDASEGFDRARRGI